MMIWSGPLALSVSAAGAGEALAAVLSLPRDAAGARGRAGRKTLVAGRSDGGFATVRPSGGKAAKNASAGVSKPPKRRTVAPAVAERARILCCGFTAADPCPL